MLAFNILALIVVVVVEGHIEQYAVFIRNTSVLSLLRLLCKEMNGF